MDPTNMDPTTNMDSLSAEEREYLRIQNFIRDISPFEGFAYNVLDSIPKYIHTERSNAGAREGNAADEPVDCAEIIAMRTNMNSSINAKNIYAVECLIKEDGLLMVAQHLEASGNLFSRLHTYRLIVKTNNIIYLAMVDYATSGGNNFPQKQSFLLHDSERFFGTNGLFNLRAGNNNIWRLNEDTREIIPISVGFGGPINILYLNEEPSQSKKEALESEIISLFNTNNIGSSFNYQRWRNGVPGTPRTE